MSEAFSTTKRLYPSQLKQSSSFRSWSERFLSGLEMDNADIAKAFRKGGKCTVEGRVRSPPSIDGDAQEGREDSALGEE